MRDATPEVAAVVLSWNNFSDTDECLRSLAAATYSRLTIILVDNCSTDGSFERLDSEWGHRLHTVRTAANLGVAGGYNAGIRAALDGGAAFVLLLNNDTVIEPNLIEALLPAFDAVPRLGTVSPIITYYHDRDRVWFAGAVYYALPGVSRHRFLGQPLSAADNLLGRLSRTDYIPNCSAMVPAPVFEGIGLLDEGFFVGLEDIDWGLRLRRAGYEVRVLGEPLVAHKVSVSTGVAGSTTLARPQAYYYALSSMLIASKWARGWRLLPYIAGQLFIRLPYYSIQMLTRGRFRSVGSYILGFWDGYERYFRTTARPRPEASGR